MTECRVYFRDYGGIEHGVYVQAENRYHAFGLAMVRLGKCSWCNPDFREVRRMTVQLLGGGTRWRKMVVTREDFEAWLNQAGVTTDERERRWVKMALGRIAPDRDFKQSIGAR
jgi:hypothetical protein